MRRAIPNIALFISLSCLQPAPASTILEWVNDGRFELGDQYRVAFVTSTTRDATSANSDDYNNFVTVVANGSSYLEPVVGDWKAIVSTWDNDVATNARDNTNTNPAADTGVPIYTVNGALIASNYSGLWNSVNHNLATSISFTEEGDELITKVWTGTGSGGTYHFAIPHNYPTYGYSQGTGVDWTMYGWGEYGGNANNDAGSTNKNYNYLERSLYGISAVQNYNIPEADFDLDGDVDGDDFLAWQASFGVDDGGDADNDGDTDGDDFLIWQSEFGLGSGSASAAVPEPVSFVLSIAALVGAIFFRRRH